MTVSVAIIVKNEETVLGRLLDSLRGAVDEIVVVDTGSTDATKDIARVLCRCWHMPRHGRTCLSSAAETARRPFVGMHASSPSFVCTSSSPVSLIHQEKLSKKVQGSTAQVPAHGQYL